MKLIALNWSASWKWLRENVKSFEKLWAPWRQTRVRNMSNMKEGMTSRSSFNQWPAYQFSFSLAIQMRRSISASYWMGSSKVGSNVFVIWISMIMHMCCISGLSFTLVLNQTSWEYTYEPKGGCNQLKHIPPNFVNSFVFPDYMLSRFLTNLLSATYGKSPDQWHTVILHKCMY